MLVDRKFHHTVGSGGRHQLDRKDRIPRRFGRSRPFAVNAHEHLVKVPEIVGVVLLAVSGDFHLIVLLGCIREVLESKVGLPAARREDDVGQRIDVAQEQQCLRDIVILGFRPGHGGSREKVDHGNPLILVVNQGVILSVVVFIAQLDGMLLDIVIGGLGRFPGSLGCFSRLDRQGEDGR